jgi:hypothetical protein
LRVSDRLVLVEDESTIPWGRFRMAGSRNYRLPSEACVEVEADGITLSLDLARSDLLVDAELARFADETTHALAPLALVGADLRTAGARRRFMVSAGSLARAESTGLSASSLAQWYLRRTGTELPPAVRLLLVAHGPRAAPLSVSRPLVLTAPSEEILDGLVQHPETRNHLGVRLGPTSVVVPEGALDELRAALEQLGLSLDELLRANSVGTGGDDVALARLKPRP